MDVKLNSLYICVKDMGRAIAFYEELLERQVTEKDDIYSVFDIRGFRLGLFAFEKVGESHEYGSNCLPSLSFENLKMLENKIAGKDICFPLTRIKENWVAEIVDSEGNHIEVTAPV
ncbi:MAG: VOC family protein [Butyrivibrio sp.]|nr:VOC family protein [Butyrivibrio sp.]